MRIRLTPLILTAMTLSAVVVLVTAGKIIAQDKSQLVVQEAVMQERPPLGYVLGIYEGHLALFREGSQKPYQVLDTEVWLLSDAELAELTEGICVQDEAALRTLLEDYTG